MEIDCVFFGNSIKQGVNRKNLFCWFLNLRSQNPKENQTLFQVKKDAIRVYI